MIRAIAPTLPTARGFSRARGSAESGELRLYDVIGSDWFGGITAKDVANALDSMKGAKALNVYINSPGGDVFEGLAIYNLLRRFDGEVAVHIDGLAASAASLIAMAGDRIVMPKTAMMMIHNAWTWVAGNAKELRKVADDLDQISVAFKAGYLERTKMKAEELDALLDAETWLTAEEALAKKFCTEVLQDDETSEEEAAAKVAHPVLDKFAKTPEKIRAASKKSDVQLARMGLRVKQLTSGRATRPAPATKQ